MMWSKWHHCSCTGDGKSQGKCGILLNDVWHSTVIKFPGLNSSFQGLKFVRWKGTAPVKEMLKKGTDSGTTWTGFWIE